MESFSLAVKTILVHKESDYLWHIYIIIFITLL